MSIVLLGATSGSVTLAEPAVGGSTVIDIPAASGTMVVTGSSPSLANVTATGNLTVNGNTTLGDASTDTVLMTGAPSIGGAGLGLGMGFRNRIINGDMRIDQRNAGASVTPTVTNYPWSYSVDRWSSVQTQASKFSIQQNAGSVTPPAGFVNYLGVTVGASANVTVGAADLFMVLYRLEGYSIADLNFGSANANTTTLSFWVRSSLTGTFGGALVSGTDDYLYPFSYTIAAANTWQKVTVTVTGPTQGTYSTTNGYGLSLCITFGAGSNFIGTPGAWTTSAKYAPTGQTNLISTNSATFYVTGVQLEKGSTATAFDYRPYGTELQLCQRYAVMLGNSGDYYSNYGYGAAYTTTNVSATVSLPVQMRAIPTVSFPGSGDFMFYRGVGNISSASANMTGGNPEGTTTVGAYYFVGTGLTAGTFGKVQSSNSIATRVLFSAEL